MVDSEASADVMRLVKARWLESNHRYQNLGAIKAPGSLRWPLVSPRLHDQGVWLIGVGQL